jgi:hypothetical protein
MKPHVLVFGVLLLTLTLMMVFFFSCEVDFSLRDTIVTTTTTMMRTQEEAAPRRRLVVSMSTFSRSVRATSLQAIERLISIATTTTAASSSASGGYDRLIVSIPLARRFGSAPPEPSVADVLAFYGQALGEFLPAGKEEEGGFHNANHSMYVQFLEEDFGPTTTQLLGALLVETEPDTIILTVDDHGVYPPSLLTFFRGNAPTLEACQTFAGAAAYRVGFFSVEEVFALARKNRSHGCFMCGDAWLSGYLKSKRGVRCAPHHHNIECIVS